MHIDEHGRIVFVGQEALDEFAQGLSRRLTENRKLHHKTTFQDLPVSVENRVGSVRSGTDPDGEEWRTKMKFPYGYIPGTEGADGDALDVFVGPNENAAFAYIVHSNNPETGEFDEDKVMLGFPSADRAKMVFLQHCDDPKFFGGMDSIPMWKFRLKVWVKKHTTKKLVASRRNREASLQLPEGMFDPPRYGEAGTGLDQDMRKAILGHHQDIMVNPQVREHGVKGMKWGTRTPREIIEHVGMEYKGEMENPKGGSIHLFNDPKTGSTLAMRDHEIKDPQTVRDKVALSRQEFRRAHSGEAREHGVKGMKWGVRHARHDARGVKRGKGDNKKSVSIHKRNLANDPHTMNMMQVVHRSQQQLDQISQKQQQDNAVKQQQGQKPVSPKENHNEALKALAELGWKILEVGSKVTGTEGIFNVIRSIVKSPTGQKLSMVTKGEKHTLATDEKGKAPASKPHQPKYQYTPRKRIPVKTSMREAAPFEVRMGRFLREARRRVYYARPLDRYGTDAEEADMDMIREAFPEHGINSPRTRRHADLGMGYFHKKINRAKAVVVKPTRRNRLTAGVFSEARHAIKKKIPVYAIYKGRLRRVKSVETLGNPNNQGHFGKVIFRKRRKK